MDMYMCRRCRHGVIGFEDETGRMRRADRTDVIVMIDRTKMKNVIDMIDRIDRIDVIDRIDRTCRADRTHRMWFSRKVSQTDPWSKIDPKQIALTAQHACNIRSRLNPR